MASHLPITLSLSHYSPMAESEHRAGTATYQEPWQHPGCSYAPHQKAEKDLPGVMFLPGESQGWGSLVAAVYGVAQSRT